MLIVADGSKASWKDTDGVTLKTDVNWIGFNLSFHPFGPVGVTNSGASVSDDFDVVKNVPAVDIDI